MKKILLVGSCPLPDENVKIRPAAGLRTNQFLSLLKELARTGEIWLEAVLIAMPDSYENEVKTEVYEEGENYKIYRISKDASGLNAFIQAILDSGHEGRQFDAVVAVNTFPSFVASGIKGGLPLWCDLNGWIMAEAQAQAYKMASNNYLGHYFEMEKKIMMRADKVSAVSGAEKMALYGELATFGRLNKETFGYKFAEHIPNGVEPLTDKEKVAFEGAAFTIPGLPEGAFSLLWLGGYNTWVDEHTLFKALEMAMQKCEDLYFVSTGGGLEGLDNKTFARFKEMVDGCKYRDRFIFLGWVDSDDIPAIYARADVGINVDRQCVETLTGARNRINEMMKFGLPIITTIGSEIAGEVAKHEAGIAVPSGDHEALAEAIIEMHELWRGGGERVAVELKNYGKNGQKYIAEKCRYKATTEALIKWIKAPMKAPDLELKVQIDLTKKNIIKKTLQYLKDRGIRQFLKKLWQRLRNYKFD